MVQWREPNRTGRRRAPVMRASKRFEPPDSRAARASREALSSVGCIRMKDIPVPDQLVFRKIGSFEEKRARQGSETMACFRLRKREERSVVQAGGGIGWR